VPEDEEHIALAVLVSDCVIPDTMRNGPVRAMAMCVSSSTRRKSLKVISKIIPFRENK
jgi:hypothetical protein